MPTDWHSEAVAFSKGRTLDVGIVESAMRYAATLQCVECMKKLNQDMAAGRKAIEHPESKWNWDGQRAGAPNDGTQRGRDAEATNTTETRTRPSLK